MNKTKKIYIVAIEDDDINPIEIGYASSINIAKKMIKKLKETDGYQNMNHQIYNASINYLEINDEAICFEEPQYDDNNDLSIQFALLWGMKIESALSVEEIEEANIMKEWNSQELNTLFSSWAQEYLNQDDEEDTVEFFETKLSYLLYEDDIKANICNGWSHGYTSAVIIGASKREVLKKIKNIPNWKDIFYNFSEIDGCFLVDVYQRFPDDVCKIFNQIGENVIVYGFCHWDIDLFVTKKNGKTNDDYYAEFVDGFPHLSDEDENNSSDVLWDVEVIITDKQSGYSFIVGGGMCSKVEKDRYEFIVLTH